jgi:hypothetical protein
MAELGDADFESQMESLAKYEDVFLERSEEIEAALESVITKSVRVEESEIRTALDIALAGAGDSDSEFQEAVLGLLRIILLGEVGPIEALSDKNVKEEFRSFVLLCTLEYGNELQRLNFRSTQGSNWWSFIETDQIRTNENIRHRHRLVVDRDEEIEIDSLPFADWVFVRHFLQQILISFNLMQESELYNPSTGDPLELINEALFNEIRAYIYIIWRTT